MPHLRACHMASNALVERFAILRYEDTTLFNCLSFEKDNCQFNRHLHQIVFNT